MNAQKLLKAFAFIMVLLFTQVSSKCPNIKLQEDFDAERYMGNWYEMVRSNSIRFEKYDCVKAHYSFLGNGKVSVSNSQYDEENDQISGVKGTAVFKGPVAKVKFNRFMPAGDYQVVSTDYNNYAIVYSCTSFLFFNFEFVWILTREKSPTKKQFKAYFDILAERIPNYTLNDFHITKQDGTCKYSEESVEISEQN